MHVHTYKYIFINNFNPQRRRNYYIVIIIICSNSRRGKYLPQVQAKLNKHMCVFFLQLTDIRKAYGYIFKIASFFPPPSSSSCSRVTCRTGVKSYIEDRKKMMQTAFRRGCQLVLKSFFSAYYREWDSGHEFQTSSPQLPSATKFLLHFERNFYHCKISILIRIT